MNVILNIDTHVVTEIIGLHSYEVDVYDYVPDYDYENQKASLGNSQRIIANPWNKSLNPSFRNANLEQVIQKSLSLDSFNENNKKKFTNPFCFGICKIETK